MPLNFQASEKEDLGQYNVLKDNATQCDKQWDIEKQRETQLAYTHLRSNDNESRLVDKPAKYSHAAKNQQVAVQVRQNASVRSLQ